jgi:hypothetical protein
MPDLFTIKTEISKNSKTLIKMERWDFKLNDCEINQFLQMTYNDYSKDYGNGIYAKVAVILEEKTGIKLSEDAVRKRLERMK